MANTQKDLIELDPEGLHARGLRYLGFAVDGQAVTERDPRQIAADAGVAQAFFFAAVSAGFLAEPTGSHRAVAPGPAQDKTLGERVHSG